MFKQTRLAAEKIKTQQKKRTRIEDVLDTKENEEMNCINSNSNPIFYLLIKSKKRKRNWPIVRGALGFLKRKMSSRMVLRENLW